MHFLFSISQWVCLVPIIVGSIYSILCVLSFLRFRTRTISPYPTPFTQWPPVTLLKPVRGLEKNQRINLRSACLQDYPEFQVVFAAQEPDDPVIPLLREIEKEFGPERVSVAIENHPAGPNGKINNLLGALPYARYDLLVISDSDALLKPDYLRTIIAPLADPGVGYVCTLYKAIHADRWFEKMGLLTLNADFIPSVIFAFVSGASRFCLGASMAFRRQSLKEIGGFEAFASYLAEDFEMGKRLWVSGKRMALAPYFVDIVVDLKDLSHWWSFQVCWDQKTRAARPGGFFASLILRSIPFSLLFAGLRLGDPLGLMILGAALAIRLSAAGIIMGWGMKDGEGLRSLPLLPLRDIAGLVSWVLSFTKKTVLWRGTEFALTRRGGLMIREGRP